MTALHSDKGQVGKRRVKTAKAWKKKIDKMHRDFDKVAGKDEWVWDATSFRNERKDIILMGLVELNSLKRNLLIRNIIILVLIATSILLLSL